MTAAREFAAALHATAVEAQADLDEAAGQAGPQGYLSGHTQAWDVQELGVRAEDAWASYHQAWAEAEAEPEAGT